MCESESHFQLSKIYKILYVSQFLNKLIENPSVSCIFTCIKENYGFHVLKPSRLNKKVGPTAINYIFVRRTYILLILFVVKFRLLINKRNVFIFLIKTSKILNLGPLNCQPFSLNLNIQTLRAFLKYKSSLKKHIRICKKYVTQQFTFIFVLIRVYISGDL
jgi:hypothetical protein